MKVIKKILKYLLIIICIILLGFVGLIVFAIITDYKPKEEVIISQSGDPSVLNNFQTINLLTWNIGYAGLDKDMDFFFDGGTKVITPESNCLNNLRGIRNFLKNNDSIDFIFLQEVDRGSKRSYYLDEYDTLLYSLTRHYPFFAKNYDVFFVPKPVSDPMGKVLSGITTFSKYKPSKSIRYRFPGDFGFPTQLFWLDRCFLVNRYPLANGKDLIIINTHNEAFDEGDIRKAQMEYLKGFILSEFSKGNYVIAGGDWNQCPPDFVPEFRNNVVNNSQMIMPSDYLPKEWKWVYDATTPSNRTVISAYDVSTTTTTVIDFFLLSPNIAPVYVKCIQKDFENSDHNPVIIKVQLR
jgi:endonuclease/exonuclease/phosphatase family metal-dependent hydrolase